MTYALGDTEALGRSYTLLSGFLSGPEKEISYVVELEQAKPVYGVLTTHNFTE
jgi:hypothetical protein